MLVSFFAGLGVGVAKTDGADGAAAALPSSVESRKEWEQAIAAVIKEMEEKALKEKEIEREKQREMKRQREKEKERLRKKAKKDAKVIEIIIYETTV